MLKNMKTWIVRHELGELSYITLSVLIVIAIVTLAMLIIYPLLTMGTEAAIQTGITVGEKLE